MPDCSGLYIWKYHIQYHCECLYSTTFWVTKISCSTSYGATTFWGEILIRSWIQRWIDHSFMPWDWAAAYDLIEIWRWKHPQKRKSSSSSESYKSLSRLDMFFLPRDVLQSGRGVIFAESTFLIILHSSLQFECLDLLVARFGGWVLIGWWSHWFYILAQMLYPNFGECPGSASANYVGYFQGSTKGSLYEKNFRP